MLSYNRFFTNLFDSFVFAYHLLKIFVCYIYRMLDRRIFNLAFVGFFVEALKLEIGCDLIDRPTLHRELSEEQSSCFQPEGSSEALRATRQTA
jgi:hypothetical protein